MARGFQQKKHDGCDKRAKGEVHGVRYGELAVGWRRARIKGVWTEHMI
jgi:hypothetical protein